jgi:CTP synthase
MKFIVIHGGVISGVGKGIMTSSLGVILKNYGQNVEKVYILKE